MLVFPETKQNQTREGKKEQDIQKLNSEQPASLLHVGIKCCADCCTLFCAPLAKGPHRCHKNLCEGVKCPGQRWDYYLNSRSMKTAGSFQQSGDSWLSTVSRRGVEALQSERLEGPLLPSLLAALSLCSPFRAAAIDVEVSSWQRHQLNYFLSWNRNISVSGSIWGNTSVMTLIREGTPERGDVLRRAQQDHVATGLTMTEPNRWNKAICKHEIAWSWLPAQLLIHRR